MFFFHRDRGALNKFCADSWYFWKISGKKESVFKNNENSIESLQRFSGTYPPNVWPLQYWKPSTEDLKERDTLKKTLSLLKKT